MEPKTNYVSQNSFCRNKSNYVDQVHFCWRKAIILVKQNYAGKQLYWSKAIIMTLPIILVKSNYLFHMTMVTKNNYMDVVHAA